MVHKKLSAKLTRGFLKKWWSLIAAAFLLLICGTFLLLFFSTFVNYILDTQLPLKDGSRTFNLWRKPPVDIAIRIYVYNMTNSEDFLTKKQKPILQEVGPYVYLETYEKVNIKFNDNGTLTFNQRKLYHFARELSNGTDNDVVTVPNIPLLGVTSNSKNQPSIFQVLLQSVVAESKSKPFVNVTVNQLLWGYNDPLLGIVNKMSADKIFPEKIALLYEKNGTYADNITVFTGGNDITNFNTIEKINGQDHLPGWKDDICNSIKGTDGTVFPPHMDHNSIIYLFDSFFCRIIPLKFQKEVDMYDDFKGYKFTARKDLLYSSQNCSCYGNVSCAPSGTFSISPCQFSLPLSFSFPHFYMGNDTFRTSVQGIFPPDPKKHEFFAIIQPDTGVPLKMAVRLQLNLNVKHVDSIEAVREFPDIVFPIIWFEDGFQQLSVKVTDELKVATDVLPNGTEILTYVLLLVGAVGLMMSVFCLFRTSNRREIMNLEKSANFVVNYEENKKKKGTTNDFLNGNN